MRIALLGGSFDPPHNAHLLIAKHALAFADIDELWFLPNFGQVPPKNAASSEHRLAMTKLLTLSRTRVSTIEMDHKLNGETINVLPFLPKEHSFFFIIGSDQLRMFHRWRDWEKLLEAMPFWVYPRKGFVLEPLYAGMQVLPGEEIDISSTEIRENVRLGRPIDQFVPPAIAQYIQEYKLYS